MNLPTIISRVIAKVLTTRRLSIKHEIESKVFSKRYNVVRIQLDRQVRQKNTLTAVVVHLYYSESWQDISRKLKFLSEFPFDLFISLPAKNSKFKNTILKDFPKAFIYESPNRGRDVLPFMSIAENLYKKGYIHVLKVHSKKSTHRTDGSEWMNNMLNSLIPENPKVQKQLMQTLEKPHTAIIGPKGQYVSLIVNFEANGVHMTKIVRKIYSNQIAHKALQIDRQLYGFFAGTMFWLNLESISSLFRYASIVRKFEREEGQIDATLAHALERLICVVPEIEGKKIYEVGSDRVSQIENASGVVPDWSNIYIGPKSKN